MSLYAVSTVTSLESCHKFRAVHASTFDYAWLVLPWLDDFITRNRLHYKNLQDIDFAFVLVTSLPLGPILTFTSFYLRAQCTAPQPRHRRWWLTPGFCLFGLQLLQMNSSSSETFSGLRPMQYKWNQSSQPSHWTQWTWKRTSKQTVSIHGRKSWSSGYGRRLMFLRSWVQILAPYTIWTFFHICICCKNL